MTISIGSITTKKIEKINLIYLVCNSCIEILSSIRIILSRSSCYQSNFFFWHTQISTKQLLLPFFVIKGLALTLKNQWQVHQQNQEVRQKQRGVDAQIEHHNHTIAENATSPQSSIEIQRDAIALTIAENEEYIKSEEGCTIWNFQSNH